MVLFMAKHRQLHQVVVAIVLVRIVETGVSVTSGSGSFVVAPGSVTTFTITVTNSNEVSAGIRY